MKKLIFDTSTKLEIVTLQNDDHYTNQSQYIEFSHSVSLFTSIEHGLKKLNLSIYDLDLIGVGTGPGSFTGLRIAISTARMLAQLIECPLIGVPTHLLMASSIEAENNSNILITFDARKNRVFGALYKKNAESDQLQELITPGDYPIELLLDHIDLSCTTHATGDGITKYNDQVTKKIPNLRIYETITPHAQAICALVENLYTSNKKKYSDFNTVLPNYARKSDAEIIKKRRDEKK